MERFWDVFIRPALNLRSAEASAALGLFTVQTALLGEKGAGDLLLPTAPLGAMHGDAAGEALRVRGAEVRLGARVVALEPGAAVLADGERVRVTRSSWRCRRRRAHGCSRRRIRDSRAPRS